MGRKECMKWNGKVISVELLHELASDHAIRDIVLGDSVSGTQIQGCKERKREYDRWELLYNDGRKIMVYV